VSEAENANSAAPPVSPAAEATGEPPPVAPATEPTDSAPRTEATEATEASRADAAPADADVDAPATGTEPPPGAAADARRTGPAPIQVGRLRKAAMIAFFVFFATLIALSNTVGHNPLAGARVATKFGMFSAPPKSQPIVVRGVPRRGRTVEVLTNPNAADEDWRERLRDQRERKWHDNVGRAGGLQQGYLAYRCRVHGADYRKVQLVALEDIGMPEKVILERNCAPLPADMPRAAR
jgi:hypothetical protein